MANEKFDAAVQRSRMLIREQDDAALRRYQERTALRAGIEQALQSRSPVDVDSSQRGAVRRALIDPRDGLALERLIGASDLFPLSYLEAGLSVGRSVCHIEMRDAIGRVLGHATGFLVSPSLLMTNHHVLENSDVARFSLAQFNYETDLQLLPRPIRSFRLDPDRFFLSDAQLDVSLVAVEAVAAEGVKLTDFGFLPLLSRSGKVLLGEYVSIIQHPAGAPKALAIRENQVNDVFDDFIHYATDTEPGSSGSPVFSDSWQLVALHHAGVPDANDSTRYVANEGIRISSIAAFLRTRRVGLNTEQQRLLDELLAAEPTAPAGDAAIPPMLVEEPSLERYTAAQGYDQVFLGASHKVPLPTLRADLEQDVARSRDGRRALDYSHFSVVMSKSRRLAYFTAVNIDGRQLKEIVRTADTWYFDPRLERKYQSGPELYGNNELDRGHLVRRLDPVWGSAAHQANEDTFHFTNCAPQHKNLNQKSWQDLEEYILQNAELGDLKVTVFTGPVFRIDDLLYRRQFQIPAEFWKVVVMVKQDGSLSATAYLQTQKNLIENLEFAYGQYKTYQVPVARIEQLVGLDFGDLRRHDPIANIEATVGRAIEQADDIRL